MNKYTVRLVLRPEVVRKPYYKSETTIAENGIKNSSKMCLKRTIENDNCTVISFTTFELSAEDLQIVEHNVDDLQLPSIAVFVWVSPSVKDACMFFYEVRQIKHGKGGYLFKTTPYPKLTKGNALPHYLLRGLYR